MPAMKVMKAHKATSHKVMQEERSRVEEDARWRMEVKKEMQKKTEKKKIKQE